MSKKENKAKQIIQGTSPSPFFLPSEPHGWSWSCLLSPPAHPLQPLFSASLCHHFVTACHPSGPAPAMARMERALVLPSLGRGASTVRLSPRGRKWLNRCQYQQVVFRCFPWLLDWATRGNSEGWKRVMFLPKGTGTKLKEGLPALLTSHHTITPSRRKSQRGRSVFLSPCVGKTAPRLQRAGLSREARHEKKFPSRPHHRESRQRRKSRNAPRSSW